MKLEGYKRSNFTAKESGSLVTGYNLYLSYPVTGEDACGIAFERIYMSDSKLAKCGYKPHVGDEVNVTYNRFGKVDFIFPVK